MYRQAALLLLLLLGVNSHGQASQLAGQSPLVVNEIMYAPASPEPEWIEILNRSGTPVNVKKWQITDATGSRHVLSASDIIIAAGAYLLLTRDSAALHGARGALPCAVVSVSGFPSLNNSGDAVVLLDAQGRTVDSMYYQPEWGGNLGGASLERRDADASSTDRQNWGTCNSGAGATPGGPNSLLRLLHDLTVTSRFLPGQVADTIVVIVRNAGKLPAWSYALLIYEDSNRDSIPEPGELLDRCTPDDTLGPGDSLCGPFTPV